MEQQRLQPVKPMSREFPRWGLSYVPRLLNVPGRKSSDSLSTLACARFAKKTTDLLVERVLAEEAVRPGQDRRRSSQHGSRHSMKNGSLYSEFL
jgi:hypothetical protein